MAAWLKDRNDSDSSGMKKYIRCDDDDAGDRANDLIVRRLFLLLEDG